MKKYTLTAAIVILIAIGIFYISDDFSFSPEPDFVETTALSIEGCEDLYISPEGDDSNSGLREDQAKYTLAEAFKKVSPGCAINVLPGTYVQSVMLHGIGDADHAIAIRGIKDDEGNLPVFDGNMTLATGIEAAYTKNIAISNLAFRNYTDQGVYMYNCSDMLVEDSLFEDNGFGSENKDLDGEGFGLNVDTCDRVTIRNNQAYRNGPSEELFKKGHAGTGINTYMMNDALIENNISNDNMGGGFLVEDSERVTVTGNTMNNNKADLSFDQWWDAGLWVDGGKDITVTNNTAIGNEGPAFQISDEDNQSPTGYVVEGNLIRDNYYAFFIWNLGDCPNPPEEVLKYDSNRIEGSLREDVLCFEGDYESLPS